MHEGGEPRLGRPRPARAVGSALLLEGLEAGVSVVLDAEVLDTAQLSVEMTRGPGGSSSSHALHH
jgi:hypothetical protein